MIDRNLLQLPGMKGVLFALFGAAVVTGALIFGQAWFLAQAITALAAGAPTADCAESLGLFLGCYGGRQLLSFLQNRALDHFALETATTLEFQLLEHLFAGGAPWVRKIGSATVLEAAGQGCAQVEDYLRLLPPKLCALMGTASVLLVGEAVIDWVSAVILIVTTPVILYFMQLLGRQAKDRAARQFDRYQRLGRRFLDTLRGLPAIVSLGAQNREADATYAASEELREATMKTLSVATLSSALLDLTATLGVAAVAMMLAFRLMDGSISLAFALCALMVAPEFYTPLRSFAADFHGTLDAKSSLANILKLIGTKSEEAPRETVPSWTAASVLKIDAATFEYDNPRQDENDTEASLPHHRALDSVSLTLHGNECAAIIGRSGSGKSTLANVIAGLKSPNSGSFVLDGTPLSTLAQKGWTSQVHYIPQHPHLFAATLRENIAFYSPHAPEDAIEAAVRDAGLEEFVSQLDAGLDTRIGAGGRAVSGGQAQRIALARAFVDPRPVLVLDEPTAHLDVETERDLMEPLERLMKGRLTILCTHRYHWLAQADRVFFLEAGHLQELPEAIKARAQESSKDAPPQSRECTTAAATSTQAVAAKTEAQCALEIPRPTVASPRPSLLSFALGLLGGRGKQALFALGLGLATFACAALLMFASGYLISKTAQPSTTLFSVMTAVALVQLFGLGRPVARYFERLASHDWVFRATSRLREMLFRGACAQALRGSRATAAEHFETLVESIGHLQNLYLRCAFPLFIALMLGVGACMLCGLFSFSLLAAMVPAVLICALGLPALAAAFSRRAAAPLQTAAHNRAKSLTDDVFGIKDWVLSGRREEGTKRAHDAFTRWRMLALNQRRRVQGSETASALILGSALTAIALVAGSSWGGTPEMSNYIAAFTLGFFPLAEVFLALPQAAATGVFQGDSLVSLSALAQKAASLDPQSSTLQEKDGKSVPRSSKDAPEAATVIVDKVVAGYAEKAVLRGISLSIASGQAVALLGRSGAGKTTLIDVIRGFLTPRAGIATICGRCPDPQNDPGRMVGFLSQNPYLFDRSLRENLLLAVPDATDGKLTEALERVGLADKLASLPKGLDTPIGEGGVGFSGGEAHRVALARVLLCRCPLVILDEPFAALDPATEEALLTTLFDVFADRTLIIATHHLAQIDRFDQVVFLEKGRVALQGTPQYLQETSAYFRALCAFDHTPSHPHAPKKHA